jgi:hypothetical protein
LVGTTATDDTGKYFVAWDAKYKAPSQVFLASITKKPPIESISMFTGLQFQSNQVKVAIQEKVQQIAALTIEQLQSNVIEGKTVDFSGTAAVTNINSNSSEPITNIPICIFDEVTSQLLSSGKTDENGKYHAQWKSVYREKPYMVYASFFENCDSSNVDLGYLGKIDTEQYLWTNTYPVTVYEIPTLHLEPIVEATQGDIITLNGFITSENFAGHQVNVAINGQVQFSSSFDENGFFSLNLDSSQTPTGNYKTQLQCDCEGLNLLSNTQIITIIAAEPLDTSIIPLVNESEGIPVSVTFDSNVTGGQPPYVFSWYVEEELISNSDSITKGIVEGDAYTVTLVVVDSVKEKVNDAVSVSVNALDKSSALNAFLEVEGDMVEGSPMTFRAEIDSEAYPFAINQIRWKFGEEPEIIGGLDFGEITRTFDDNGIYDVKVTVVDENGQEFTSSKELFIENIPPQIQPPQQEVMSFEGNVVLEAEFSDPGIKDTFTVTWSEGDQVIRNYKQNTQNTIHDEFKVEPGTHVFRLTVSDDDGSSDISEFTITEYVIEGNNEINYTAESQQELWPIAVAIGGIGAGILSLKLLRKRSAKQDAQKSDDRRYPSIEIDFRGGIKK